jgi:hypothetical protein
VKITNSKTKPLILRSSYVEGAQPNQLEEVLRTAKSMAPISLSLNANFVAIHLNGFVGGTLIFVSLVIQGKTKGII